MSVGKILTLLRGQADPAAVKGMARYGMSSDKRLGVSTPFIRQLAKEVGRNHETALALWETGVPEARILAAMIGDPEELTADQMDTWVRDIDSRDICDQVCMKLFEKSPLAWKKIRDWHTRDEEFVKRAAYSLIACLAWHDKTAEDEKFIELLPVIRAGAIDDRNYVKKAVSWALRHIGKRNGTLNAAALSLAKELESLASPPARWIASQAVRELRSEKVRLHLMKQGT